jgi:hypothetical protein
MSVRALLFLAVLISLALVTPCVHADTFTVETAFPTSAEVGHNSSIAVDANGDPHVTHNGYLAGEGLWYSRRVGGEWIHECVQRLLFTGNGSLALDAAGNPSVAFTAGREFSLRYARREGGVWTIEVVDPLTGQHASLELDAAGNPRIAYETGGILKYAYRDAGVWTIEWVDFPGKGRSASLALDAAGRPHITHIDGRIGVSDILYARKLGGIWLYDVVDDGGGSSALGVRAALALGPSGAPHVAYRDATLTDLRYATKVAGSWAREVVDDGGDNPTGSDAFIAVDEAGVPHISYHRHVGAGFDADLLYATKSGGGWQIVMVDEVGSVGRYGSIALDDLGRTHFGYQDIVATDLKYAVSSTATGVPLSSSFALHLEAVPNPVGVSGAELRFRIEHAAGGDLSIFDVTGRRVARLYAGPLAIGDGALRWGGRDDAGERVAPGVYFARLVAGSASRTERLVLVR